MKNRRACITCKYSVWDVAGLPPHCRRAEPHALELLSSAFPVVFEEATWCFKYRRSIWRTLKRWWAQRNARVSN